MRRSGLYVFGPDMFTKIPVLSETPGMLSVEAENDGEDSPVGIANEPHVTFQTLSSSRQRTGRC
jgi:hypothetical protein